jgi:hypothetical protein
VNSEPELSAEARRVIASAKGYDDPTPEDRDRIKSRWLASVAAAASVSALGEAARAASTSGWGVKAIGWIVALAAGAAGIYVLLDEPSPPNIAAPAPATRSVVAAPAPIEATSPPMPPVESMPLDTGAGEAKRAEPAAIEGVAPVARSAPAKPPAPARPAAVREPVAPPPAALEVAQPAVNEVAEAVSSAPEAAAVPVPSPEASRQLGEETLLLSKIRRSLREGAPARALDELAEYRQRFDKPLLGMEAAALRVDALCRSGNVEAGRDAAELFQATWPSSPLEQRVRAACQ